MDWKSLYIEWLSEAREKAREKRAQSYVCQAYDRAIDSLEHCDLAEINDPQQLKPLRFIGDKTISFLSKKTKAHCKKHGLDLPASLEERPSSSFSELMSQATSEPTTTRSRVYVPKYNTVGCHALIGLRKIEKTSESASHGIGKTELARLIKPRVVRTNDGKMMPNITPALSTLVRNGLVYIHNSRFFLEEKGREVADGFLAVEGERAPASSFFEKRRTRPIQRIDLEPNTYRSERWNIGEFDVKLILDNREVADARNRNGFLDELVDRGVPIDQTNLSVGDILWVAEHKETKRRAVLDYIVERKTLQDLKMSIQDGRHNEQKTRLTRSTLPHVVYLIEFEQSISNRELFKDQKQKFQTAMSQTLVLNHFHLKVTNGQNDTIRYLTTFTEILRVRYAQQPLCVVVPHVETFSVSMKLARSQEAPTPIGIDYDSFDEGVAKSRLKTVGELFRTMLTTVKGVSPEKALAIQQLYPTPQHLLKAYLATPVELRPQMIHKATQPNIQRRRIKLSISEMLYSIWGPSESI